MGQKNSRSSFPLTLVILLGILIGVGYIWGDNILAFATGKDIMDDLVADISEGPRSLPTTVAAVVSGQGAQPAEAAADPTSDAGGDSIASDGFPVAEREHVIKYTVQPGDALFTIAEKFGIHPNTIFWANTGTLQDNVHLIQSGTELYILPINGVYHVSNGEQTIEEIASLYGVTPGDILYSDYNDLGDYESGYVPPSGLRIVVPGGRRDYISWQSPIQTGTESGRANPEGTIHPGSCRQFYSGTGGAGNYMNPLGTTLYRLTNTFQPWHPGVDITADVTSPPIYAAETGVVVFAGWHRDGYGELIILDHGDGWTTYYGHLSERFVGCGDQISRGQLIGIMGSTGNSSGLHVHFEVRHNDVPLKPSDYITIEGPVDYRGGSDG